MIPKVNLGVGEMGFIFCDLHVSQNYPFVGDKKNDVFALLLIISICICLDLT